MEKSAQFDLNAAVRRWRENMAASPAFCPESLDEIETHLRDSVRSLESKGFSPEEAFSVACRRVGQPAALAREFRKVNRTRIWLVEWLRIAVACLLFSAVAQFSRLAGEMSMMYPAAWMTPMQAPFYQTFGTPAFKVGPGGYFIQMEFKRARTLREAPGVFGFLGASVWTGAAAILIIVSFWIGKRLGNTPDGFRRLYHHPGPLLLGLIASKIEMYLGVGWIEDQRKWIANYWSLAPYVLMTILVARALGYFTRRQFRAAAAQGAGETILGEN